MSNGVPIHLHLNGQTFGATGEEALASFLREERDREAAFQARWEARAAARAEHPLLNSGIRAGTPPVSVESAARQTLSGPEALVLVRRVEETAAALLAALAALTAALDRSVPDEG